MVYKLEKDFDHLIDMDVDAYHIKFPESEFFGARLLGINSIHYPEKIFFQSNFNAIPDIDYPLSDLTDMLLSDKMIACLSGVKPFKHRKIDAVLFDDTYMEPPFENDQLKNDVKRIESYKVVHLLEYTDVFDYEKSVFEYDELFEDEVGFIKELKLKKPEGGFPPIFKIKESTSTVFVSDEAKLRLEANGIKGCIFKAVEVS